MADEKKPDTGEEAEAKPQADEASESKASEPEAKAEEKAEEKAAEPEAKAEEKAAEPEAKAEEKAAEPEAKAEPKVAASAKEAASSEDAGAVAAFTADEPNHGDHGGHEPTEVEADRPPAGPIAIAIVLSVAAIVAVVVGANELFRTVIGSELTEKVYDYPSASLRQLRAEETSKLTRYQFASKKDGVVRIPLDRAMALTLQDYAKREPTPAPAPSAAPGDVPTTPPLPSPGATPSAAPSAAPEVKEHNK